MKNKKKLCIIGGAAVCLILAAVLCIVLIPKSGDSKPAESTPTESTGGTVVIDEPVKDERAVSQQVSNKDNREER